MTSRLGCRCCFATRSRSAANRPPRRVGFRRPAPFVRSSDKRPRIATEARRLLVESWFPIVASSASHGRFSAGHGARIPRRASWPPGGGARCSWPVGSVAGRRGRLTAVNGALSSAEPRVTPGVEPRAACERGATSRNRARQARPRAGGNAPRWRCPHARDRRASLRNNPARRRAGRSGTPPPRPTTRIATDASRGCRPSRTPPLAGPPRGVRRTRAARRSGGTRPRSCSAVPAEDASKQASLVRGGAEPPREEEQRRVSAQDAGEHHGQRERRMHGAMLDEDTGGEERGVFRQRRPEAADREPREHEDDRSLEPFGAHGALSPPSFATTMSSGPSAARAAAMARGRSSSSRLTSPGATTARRPSARTFAARPSSGSSFTRNGHASA